MFCTPRARSWWRVHRPPQRSRERVAAALKSVDGQLALNDDKGRKVIVPGNLIAYVEIAHADVRRVGFVSS